MYTFISIIIKDTVNKSTFLLKVLKAFLFKTLIRCRFCRTHRYRANFQKRQLHKTLLFLNYNKIIEKQRRLLRSWFVLKLNIGGFRNEACPSKKMETYYVNRNFINIYKCYIS